MQEDNDDDEEESGEQCISLASKEANKRIDS